MTDPFGRETKELHAIYDERLVRVSDVDAETVHFANPGGKCSIYNLSGEFLQ